MEKDPNARSGPIKIGDFVNPDDALPNKKSAKKQKSLSSERKGSKPSGRQNSKAKAQKKDDDMDFD